MKLYYRAVTQDGKTIRGLIEARDEKEAAIYLRNHQLIPVKISQTTPGAGIYKYFPFLRRSTSSDLIFFTRQLSTMLTSGLTLIQALNIMKNQIQNPAMAEFLNSLIVDVENGKSLSQGIEKYPHMFNPIYIALIKTAESSGLLDKVLLRLAENLEKRQKLQRTIRGALMYPIIVIALMVTVMVVMMIFVVPNLTVLYDNLDTDLPLPTVIVVAISNLLINAWPVVLIGCVAVYILIQRWYSKESGKRIVDKFILKVPVFGKLLLQTMMSEFARTLSLLISSGSLVVDSLIKTSDVVGNYIYRDAIVTVAKRVEKGISMGDALEASSLFPPMVVEMVKIGEQTGKLDDSLMKASEYYESEVEQTVKVLTTLMEPVIMVVLALGVGFLILAVITPIYNIISHF